MTSVNPRDLLPGWLFNSGRLIAVDQTARRNVDPADRERRARIAALSDAELLGLTALAVNLADDSDLDTPAPSTAKLFERESRRAWPRTTNACSGGSASLSGSPSRSGWWRG